MEGLQMAQVIADLQSLQTAVRPPSPPSSSPSSSSSPALSPSSGTTTPDFHALASTPASSPSIFSYIFCRPGLSTPPSSRPTTPPKSAESHAEVNTTAQDPAAARALLTPLDSKPAPASSAGTSAPQSRRGSGAPKFERTGRRFVALPASRTPPLFSREGSSASMESYGGSGTSTPAGGAVTDTDNDLKRAKTLLELFEMRGKFKHMGDTGLSRAKQRVDDVVAKHAQSELDYREKDARTRHLRANK